VRHVEEVYGKSGAEHSRSCGTATAANVGGKKVLLVDRLLLGEGSVRVVVLILLVVVVLSMMLLIKLRIVSQ